MYEDSGIRGQELVGIDATPSFEEKETKAVGVDRWSRDEPKETRQSQAADIEFRVQQP